MIAALRIVMAVTSKVPGRGAPEEEEAAGQPRSDHGPRPKEGGLDGVGEHQAHECSGSEGDCQSARKGAAHVVSVDESAHDLTQSLAVESDDGNNRADLYRDGVGVRH